MQFSKLHLVLSLLPSALAGGSSTTSATSAAASPSNVKVIDVGEDGLTFSPNSTTAAVGDTIEFHFYPEKHSVAQSSFDSPCVPLNNGTGFWSGGFSTDSGENKEVFSVLINDTKPIWYYCAAPKHCQNGMAGVINPPTDASTSLTKYIAAAKDVPTSKGGTVVSGGTVGPAKAVSSASGTGTPTTSSSASPVASKSAGVETRAEAQWLVAALGSVVAVGMGALMI
ncbi:putative GPI-anchored cupredoxin [Lachnellula cervina]|uniref:Putative GPI-anchored cupredoxin n=1 Tax=Lachnellula cervina TaxID=1316786 RepID=A0A7D8UJU6_9HELO|nr:putative GPI-anchored cupredoxin [Lachnellula cervina]